MSKSMNFTFYFQLVRNDVEATLFTLVIVFCF
jgi:hypothetical protein